MSSDSRSVRIRRRRALRSAAAVLAVGVVAACGVDPSSPPTVTSDSPPTSPVAAPATAAVADSPRVALAATAVALGTAVDAPQPALAEVAVTNGGGGTLDALAVGPVAYAPGEPTGWLAATLSAAAAPAQLRLQASAAGLATGRYTATVPVASGAAGVANGPQSVTVTLTVSPFPLRLSLVAGPTSARPGIAFAPAFRVRVVDVVTGAPRPDFAGAVTVSLASGATLLGKRTVSASDGEARFDSLAVNTTGTFALRFAADGVSDTTVALTVASDEAGTLVPRSGARLTALGTGAYRLTQAIEVRTPENFLAAQSVHVTARIVRGAGTIASGDTATSVGGVATFGALQFTVKSSITVLYTAPGYGSTTVEYALDPSSTLGVRSRLTAVRDSLVEHDAVFTVDQYLAAPQNQTVGSARFDVYWDPTVLTLLGDSVLVSPAVGSIASTLTGAASGAYAAAAVSSSGLTNGAVLVRLRFRATGPSGGSALTRIETQNFDLGDATGRPLPRGDFRFVVTVRIR